MNKNEKLIIVVVISGGVLLLCITLAIVSFGFIVAREYQNKKAEPVRPTEIPYIITDSPRPTIKQQCDITTIEEYVSTDSRSMQGFFTLFNKRFDYPTLVLDGFGTSGEARVVKVKENCTGDFSINYVSMTIQRDEIMLTTTQGFFPWGTPCNVAEYTINLDIGDVNVCQLKDVDGNVQTQMNITNSDITSDEFDLRYMFVAKVALNQAEIEELFAHASYID